MSLLTFSSCTATAEALEKNSGWTTAMMPGTALSADGLLSSTSAAWNAPVLCCTAASAVADCRSLTDPSSTPSNAACVLVARELKTASCSFCTCSVTCSWAAVDHQKSALALLVESAKRDCPHLTSQKLAGSALEVSPLPAYLASQGRLFEPSSATNSSLCSGSLCPSG